MFVLFSISLFPFLKIEFVPSIIKRLIISSANTEQYKTSTNYEIFIRTNVDVNTDDECLSKHLYEIKNKNIYNQLNVDFEHNFTISKYSPFISIITSNLDNNFIYKLKNNKNIMNYEIYDNLYKTSIINDNDFDLALSDNIETYSSSTGGIIKVGIMEDGIIDRNSFNEDFSNTIVTKYYANSVVSNHKTVVAKILCNQYNNIEIYEANSKEGYLACYEWFLDNDVKVINRSEGFFTTNANGDYITLYDDYAKYFDYYVYTNDIINVISAGNQGNNHGYILQNAGTYNTVAVGASTNGNIIAPYSSFEESFGSKPNIVSNHNVSFSNNLGTSWSAPKIAGDISNLIANKLTSYDSPHLAQTILYATAEYEKFVNNGFTSFSDDGMEEKFGAGETNIIDALSLSSARYASGTIYSPYSATIFERSFTETDTFSLNLAFVQLKMVNMNLQDINFPNYSIKIKKGTTTILNASSNVQTKIIRLNNLNSGTYTVSITYPGYQTNAWNSKWSVAYHTY